MTDFDVELQTGMNAPGKYIEAAVSGGNAQDYIQQFVNGHYYSSVKYTLIDRRSYTVVILYK